MRFSLRLFCVILVLNVLVLRNTNAAVPEGCFLGDPYYKVYTYYIGSAVEYGTTYYYYSKDPHPAHPIESFVYQGSSNPDCLTEKSNSYYHQCILMTGTTIPAFAYLAPNVQYGDYGIDVRTCPIDDYIYLFFIPILGFGCFAITRRNAIITNV